MTIRGKPIKRGDPCESKWPSEFGTLDGTGVWHRDKETGEIREGYAPPVMPRYGQAPAVFGDTMDAVEHPANGQVIESKSKYRRIMKQHGYEERTGAKRVAPNKAVMKDVTRDAYERDVKIAYQQVEAGTAPLNEHDRALCKRINERIKNKV